MKEKQTAVKGVATSVDSNGHNPDVDTCLATEPAPFRTVVGGDHEGEEPYLKRETGNLAVVVIDLKGWQLVEGRVMHDFWYGHILERIWTSLTAAGHRVKHMEVALVVPDLDGWNRLSEWSDQRLFDLYLDDDDPHDPEDLRDHIGMNSDKPIVFVYITDDLKGDRQRTWDYLSNLDCVVAAHLHVYDQPVVGSSLMGKLMYSYLLQGDP